MRLKKKKQTLSQQIKIILTWSKDNDTSLSNLSALRQQGINGIRIIAKKNYWDSFEKLIDDFSNFKYLHSDFLIFIDLPSKRPRISYNSNRQWEFKKGDFVILILDECEEVFNRNVYLTESLDCYTPFLNLNDKITFYDHSKGMKIIKMDQNKIFCEVLSNTIKISPGRAFNLSNSEIKYEILTDFEKYSLKFIADYTIDGVMISMISDSEQIRKIVNYTNNGVCQASCRLN
jgi:pyruvate kinase